ncbi:MAG: hypothetical protein PPFGHCPK_01329 [Spiroplasma endosymbiont of Drosophila atripex]|nr:MAG: hypothetical protein PPFGHCPK_00027 [Spiroplasma endosymbiont of Drosophila atripex]WDA53874.1 MAG: hypothetical protein PPFGHCPK_00288 [Spiroplasma endosymbiont of Drosophila atripex]WDA54616.1 MAG: hypothetical protein PPFGHCPK_01072 [Spiroplasma endosymbiont of Drosophila atripex]WDA54848.1 MAG: hypothetical protein PPFGHCPK_01329 [Spiroplasma endosymbiont of Drosophila atripex]
MKEFIHELIIIGTSVGTLLCREIIVLLKRFITTPKHVRANNKVIKHQKKLAKLTQKIDKENKE